MYLTLSSGHTSEEDSPCPSGFCVLRELSSLRINFMKLLYFADRDFILVDQEIPHRQALPELRESLRKTQDSTMGNVG